MLVVRRIDIIFNKYTPGRDGSRYKIQPTNLILTVRLGVLFIFCALFDVCVCLYVCIGGLHRDSDRIQHQLLLAKPPPLLLLLPSFLLSHPPLPFLWHPPCPYWLDNTQPLYATCPSARLHLREPLSPSSELPLAAFVWILVNSPLLPRLSSPFSLSLCLALFRSLCCPLQTQTHRKTHTYRLVIASVSYFLHLPPGTKDPSPPLPPPPPPPPPPLSLLASHLWPGCQRLVLSRRAENAGCWTR